MWIQDSIEGFPFACRLYHVKWPNILFKYMYKFISWLNSGYIYKVHKKEYSKMVSFCVMTTINTKLPPSGRPQLQPNTMGFLFKPQRCKQSHDPSFFFVACLFSELSFVFSCSFIPLTNQILSSFQRALDAEAVVGLQTHTYTHIAS